MMEKLDMTAACERYPDRWLLIVVTEWDENGEPIGGKVIAHSRFKQAIVEAAQMGMETNPTARLFVMYTGDQNEIAGLRIPFPINLPVAEEEPILPLEPSEDGPIMELSIDASPITPTAFPKPSNWEGIYAKTPKKKPKDD